MGGNKRYPRDPAPDATRRHCWVLATAHERGPWPGLILEWRRTNSDDWQARVVYVPNPRDTRNVEMWFASHLLKPSSRRCPRGPHRKQRAMPTTAEPASKAKAAN